ncbi:MAG: CbbQ/NirQ/NorQ C-terminal domain-containing protein, partial [Nitrososphaerota archaeon]|nr:CbbQ/NirQ/NorQ C-terminal domain-containing protein [Nitrososphaerota archaeon]
TTVDALYEELARKLPSAVDEEGWDVLRLDRVEVKVISLDRVTGDLSWKRAHALARSLYRGPVVKVTTSTNRSVVATPEHSFITEDEEVKAGVIAKGARIPIVRGIPPHDSAPLTGLAVAEMVPRARLVGRGGMESIQVPGPALLPLDEEFCWFLGFFVAEGRVGKGVASICREDASLIQKCESLLRPMGLATSTRVERGLLELRISSKAFASLLSSSTVRGKAGVDGGSQARYKRVPDFMFAASDEAKGAFLRGFYDAGIGRQEHSELLLGASSRELANGLVALCEQLGIFPEVRIKKARQAPQYAVVIARDDAVRIGVYVGGTGQRGRGYRKETVGLDAFTKAAADLGSPELMRATEPRVLWDTVKNVEGEDYDGWVYDFQVPGTETFSSGFGGVLTHNTHIVYLVAQIAGLPLWEINCGLQTSVYDMFGRFVGLGRDNWIDGTIVSWCRYGGILYLDEANMMKQDIATRLNPILDTRGHMVLNEKDNEVIPRHPFGYVVISMNPYSSEFAGTKPLNAAFRRRMSVWIDFDYLSVGTKISQREVKMLAERSKITMDVAEKVVRVGAEVRKRYKTGDLPYGPSVGDLLNWATLIHDGLDPKAAADETLVSLTSDDAEIQAIVRRIVGLVFGSGEPRPAARPAAPAGTPQRPVEKTGTP